MDSKYFGVPQLRTRVYLVWYKSGSFDFPEYKSITKLNEFFEKEVDDKYYLSWEELEIAKQNRVGKIFKTGGRNWPVSLTRNELGYICALTKVNFWKTNRQTNLIQDQKGIRILTGLEFERAQGFPEGWASDILPEYLVKAVMGNSITIPVVEEIFKNLFKIKW